MFKEDIVEDSADLSTEDNNQDSYEQDDTVTEDEGEETAEEAVERQPETPEQREARIKRQVEREARKQGKTIEEYLGIKSQKVSKETNKKEVETPDVVMERLDRADLRAEGFKDKGEQDILIKYSRFEDMDVVDFASTTLGKTLIKEYRAKNATPSPTRRTGQGTRDEVAYWAEQMSKGNRPPTADLRIKARAYLAKNKK